MFWSRKTGLRQKAPPGTQGWTQSIPSAAHWHDPVDERKNKNMFRKHKYFSKAKDSLGRDLEEYGDNKKDSLTIENLSFRYVPEDLGN